MDNDKWPPKPTKAVGLTISPFYFRDYQVYSLNNILFSLERLKIHKYNLPWLFGNLELSLDFLASILAFWQQQYIPDTYNFFLLPIMKLLFIY